MPNESEPKPVSVPDSYHKAAVQMSERDRSIATLYCLQLLCGQLHAAITLLAEQNAILDNRLKDPNAGLITPPGGRIIQ